MKLPPSMQALVEASKLDIQPNTSVVFPCPKCGGEFTAYRNASGKLSGNCQCGTIIPKA